MGKWADNEEKMKHAVREQIIKALWVKISSNENQESKSDLDQKDLFENKMKKFHILKVVLGLLKEENKKYVETPQSKAFDEAIKQRNFLAFNKILQDALHQSSYQKLKNERQKDLEIPLNDIEEESDKKLAEIQNGEHLSLPPVDNSNPKIEKEDVDDLIEYMREKNISAVVSITNQEKPFVIPQDKFGANPVFSIHSVAKVFTGVLLMKMINDGMMSKDDLEKPIQLSDDVLKELSPQVREQLKVVTLKQIMLHESGLGDYLDNLEGHSAAIEAALNKGENVPLITTSNDLLKYGEKEVEPSGQFRYSNFGMLLLGFAIEKKYQDAQRAKKEEPLLGIDEIMHQFAINVIKMKNFDNRRPPNGHFNTTHQRNPQRTLLTDKGSEYVTNYVSARFASTAGGYWTTNQDLQIFGQWIKDECTRDLHFKELIETHGGEFYNRDKQAIEHSGLHADTAHFYVSLRNGTVITVLSDQGERSATNLADTILKQTTWYKMSLAPEPSIGQNRQLSPAFDKALTQNSSLAKTQTSSGHTDLTEKNSTERKRDKKI